MVRWFLILFALVVVSSCAARRQDGDESGAPVDWSKPETIDPLNPTIWDSLVQQAGEYRGAGEEAYKAKDYATSAQYWLFLARNNKRDEMAFFHLACCYAQLGKADFAARALELAYYAGYMDVDWMKQEPELAKVRGTKVFDETIQRLEQVAAGHEEQLGEHDYILGSAYLEYRVRLPEGFDPEKEHPVVILLHGYGRKPSDYMRFYDWFEAPDFIYVAPRAPSVYEGNPTGYSWYLDVPEDPEGELVYESWKRSEQYVADVLEHLKGKYKIGDAYLLGHSQGGWLALSTGIRFHDQFKGAICCSGGFGAEGFSPEEMEQGKGLRVFIAHGPVDEVEGRAARDTLTEAGYAVTYYEYDGGHGLNEGTLKAAEKWMKEE